MEEEDLKKRLLQFPSALKVETQNDRGRLIGQILASDFVGKDEDERYLAVWRFLKKRFTEKELERVEFILTDAPGDPPFEPMR